MGSLYLPQPPVLMELIKYLLLEGVIYTILFQSLLEIDFFVVQKAGATYTA